VDPNKPSYDPAIYQAKPGTVPDVEKRIAYFGFKEWAIITRNNDLLVGMNTTVDEVSDGTAIVGIESAPQQG
jgi:hypothetical protein